MLRLFFRAVGEYQVNTILAWCDQTNEAALFDPSAESELFFSEIESRNLHLGYLINTHGHLDHIVENSVVKSRYNVPLIIHALDRPMLTNPVLNLSAWLGDPVVSPDADMILEEHDVLNLGNVPFKLFHVPGHTRGSLAFYSSGMLIAGDTLFKGGIGRTDFPGCSEDQLLTSIRKKFYTLPNDTIVIPGHGPQTTIGEEKHTNPFVRG